MNTVALKNKMVFPLHIHWDGSIPAEHIFKLAQDRGRKLLLPEKDINVNKIRSKKRLKK